MLKNIPSLKKERLPLAIGGISWVSIGGVLFEMAHLAGMLALCLSFFPSLLLLFLVRALMRPKQAEASPVPAKSSVNVISAPVQPDYTPLALERFLTDFSHLMEMQKQYWEEKTLAPAQQVQPPEGGIIAFSDALKIYEQQQRAFVLWQSYKASVITLLRSAMQSAAQEQPHSLSIEKLNYQLAEKELSLFCPQPRVKEALEEVKFFLQAMWRRKKELENIIAYLDKISADGIWLSAEKRQKMKEYEKNKQLCESQIEADTDQILKNLEEIFTSL